ncbi:hypothetical protein EBB07_29070 [Paenibacillaceae bacterium]|nr:hypothetical protein EBB07_29070 [Paenibacillaceae bacterium]
MLDLRVQLYDNFLAQWYTVPVVKVDSLRVGYYVMFYKLSYHRGMDDFWNEADLFHHFIEDEDLIRIDRIGNGGVYTSDSKYMGAAPNHYEIFIPHKRYSAVYKPVFPKNPTRGSNIRIIRDSSWHYDKAYLFKKGDVFTVKEVSNLSGAIKVKEKCGVIHREYYELLNKEWF